MACFSLCNTYYSIDVIYSSCLKIYKLEELRKVPANSEKAISEAAARKEELEKRRVKEEEKLKEVMESLKEETSGLQQDKEVCDMAHIHFEKQL